MDEELSDPVVDQVAEYVRRPVALRDDFDSVVMQRVEGVERVERAERLVVPRFLLAASIGALMVGSAWIGRITAPASPSTRSTPSTLSTSSGPEIRFTVSAPGAASVHLVGDFNEWNRSATPLAATEEDGVWSVTVPLPPGRHEYAFVVDGVRWLPDPAAPRAPSDDFGTPNSVVTVTGRS